MVILLVVSSGLKRRRFIEITHITFTLLFLTRTRTDTPRKTAHLKRFTFDKDAATISKGYLNDNAIKYSLKGKRQTFILSIASAVMRQPPRARPTTTRRPTSGSSSGASGNRRPKKKPKAKKKKTSKNENEKHQDIQSITFIY